MIPHLDRRSVSIYPTYFIVPRALSEDKIEGLKLFLKNPFPERQWYERLTFWKENFQADVDSQHTFSFHHSKDHKGNEAIDKLTSVFLQTLIEGGVDLKNRKVEMEVYIDRNEVSKATAKTSGLFWHRDTMVLRCTKVYAHYSMVYLLSSDSDWTGGGMLLQKGGKPLRDNRWENSSDPSVRLEPRFNQALIFKNIDSAHSIEAINPVNDKVHRDVVVITCLL